ncbi:MAG TPA: patatin-like phospholipase family protein [Pseudonocardiaceae bacterium]
MVRRALVLGGGGVTGIGWEWGLLAGLAARGVDLSDADLIVGTSAGSVVGAQLASGVDVHQRYAAQLAPADGEIAAVLGPAAILRYALAMIGPPAPQRFRARLGRLALRARTVPESERVEVIASRLPVHEWPARRLQVTAVDAQTGELKVFDRESGVPLVLAVAASCAVPLVWPPVTIDGRRYIDGGVRSGTNADLAAGYDRVVVIAPLVRGYGPMVGAKAYVRALQAQSRVTLVSPDRAALQAIGRNVLDPTKRAPSARAGCAQAAAAFGEVRAVWCD